MKIEIKHNQAYTLLDANLEIDTNENQKMIEKK